jgi:hypothetical protein
MQLLNRESKWSVVRLCVTVALSACSSGTNPIPASAGVGGASLPVAGRVAAGAAGREAPAAGAVAAAGGGGRDDGTGGGVAAGAGGGNAGSAAGVGGAPRVPPAACNPADISPEARPVALSSIKGSSNPNPIVPAKGPLMPVVEHDPGLDTHTVYRPTTLEDKKYPIVVWANGGCVKNGTMFARFLLEIASHGFVLVADGQPNGSGTGPLETNGEPQKEAMDWIVKENERPCSKYYQKLDTTKIAAMGQSCGGLMTMGASGDKRLTTIMIWNSGMFERDQMIYMGLHTPVAYIIGGPDDVAYPQAEADFAAIEKVPVFYGNLPVGHTGTYARDNGGEFAQIGIAWLKWQLYGEMSPTASGMFVGADCGLCKNPMWTVKKKNME